MTMHPGTQYADDRNLAARQRFWQHQRPAFDIVGWVLDVAEVGAGDHVLDVGCGNGRYLQALRARQASAVGCDLSHGMLGSATPHPCLITADVAALPLPEAAFDVVLAPHMLYHVSDRTTAARELRRVLRSDGVCVIVTNGDDHLRALFQLVEAAARRTTPGWEMRSSVMSAFTLENGEAQLAGAFTSVRCVRREGVAPVTVTDADIAADYVASLADLYEDEVAMPWSEVVDEVERAVQRAIDAEGAFTVAGDVGAFVCR